MITLTTTLLLTTLGFQFDPPHLHFKDAAACDAYVDVLMKNQQEEVRVVSATCGEDA